MPTKKGTQSRFAYKVTGFDSPAARTGQAAFRFLILTKTLLEDEQTRLLFEDSTVRLTLAVGEDRRLVWYPCRGSVVAFEDVRFERYYILTASVATRFKTLWQFIRIRERVVQVAQHTF